MIIKLSSTSWCFCGDFCAAFPLTKSKKNTLWTSVQTIHLFWKITDSELVVHLVSGFLAAQAFSLDFGINRVQSSTWLNSDQRTHSGSEVNPQHYRKQMLVTVSGGPWRKYLWDENVFVFFLCWHQGAAWSESIYPVIFLLPDPVSQEGPWALWKMRSRKREKKNSQLKCGLQTTKQDRHTF